MGKVRQSLVKRLASQLVEHYGERITPDFEKNKKVVAEVLPLLSSRVRNRVAGYAASLAKRKLRPAPAMAAEGEYEAELEEVS